jgi:hypothetical protein
LVALIEGSPFFLHVGLTGELTAPYKQVLIFQGSVGTEDLDPGLFLRIDQFVVKETLPFIHLSLSHFVNTYFNYGFFVVVCQETGRAATDKGDAQNKKK